MPSRSCRPYRVGAPLAAVAVALLMQTPIASQALPSRLVHAADLIHEGSFGVPDGDGFEYTHGVLAYHAANDSLLLVGHGQRQEVAEISIPAAGGRAVLLKDFRDILDGRLPDISPSESAEPMIGGMYVEGDRMVVSAYVYYDASHRAVASHFVRPADLDRSEVSGPFRVGSLGVGFTAGYFAPIPPMWRGGLRGDILNGQCCLSIISRTSYGPSVSSVTLASLLQASTDDTVEATALLAYPEDHQALGPFDATSDLFNGTTKIRGVVLPSGTASLLFFGKHGTGTYCYGTGRDCGDPDDPEGGNHAYPYRAQVWAYDVRELARVAAGRRRPWDVKPYATWELPGTKGVEIGGVTVDPGTGRIFVAENYADGMRVRVHVLRVRG